MNKIINICIKELPKTKSIYLSVCWVTGWWLFHNGDLDRWMSSQMNVFTLTEQLKVSRRILFSSEVWYSDLCMMVVVLFKGRKTEKLKCVLECADWNPGNAAPNFRVCLRWDLVSLILILHYPGLSGYHRGECGCKLAPSESSSWVICRAWAGEAGCPSW